MFSRVDSGREAEDFVARWLEERGFVIEGRNVRLGPLELDIVARTERLIVVVEVRRRGPSSFTTPLSSVNGLKRRNVRFAGERLWNRRYKNDASVDRMRFDLACVREVNGVFTLEYVPAAF